MRITYRNHHNKRYWEERWKNIPADNPMVNTKIYPLKYAELAIKNDGGSILEAGCGNGRILRFYHNKGYNIEGFDFIKIAVNKLKKVDSSLSVSFGDITKLKYDDESFKYVLAFGLYHNLENNLEKAINETYRVLKNGGVVCASFRADNIQNRINDWLSLKKEKNLNRDDLVFHKKNFTKKEFINIFKSSGFNISDFFPVVNMPFLYKFKFFRYKTHKIFNESIARNEGYRLSFFGDILQFIIMKLFPNQFCNVFVVIAKKIYN